MENTVVVTTVTTVKSETAEDCDRPDIFEYTEIRDHFCDELKIEHVDHGVEELHHSIDVIKEEDLNETQTEPNNCKNSPVVAEVSNQNRNDCQTQNKPNNCKNSPVVAEVSNQKGNDCQTQNEPNNSKNSPVAAEVSIQNGNVCPEQVERVDVVIEKPLDDVNCQPLNKTASQQRLKRRQKIFARSRLLSNDLISAKLELVRLSSNVLKKECQRRKNAENLENKFKLQILKIRKNAVIAQNKVKLQILKTKLEIKKAKLNKLLES